MPPPPATPVVALSGNPRPGSRTSDLASRAAGAVAALLPPPAPVIPVDLALSAAELFTEDRPLTDAALKTVAGASVLLVVTPVYKASYTGLLKSFLDLLPPAALHGVAAVPVVVSADPGHALAGEVHLRPLLVELGATVPTRALAVPEDRLATADQAVAEWLATAGPLLAAAVRPADGR